eukprot:364515-Chlamydomonas_euryale.AAC.8
MGSYLHAVLLAWRRGRTAPAWSCTRMTITRRTHGSCVTAACRLHGFATTWQLHAAATLHDDQKHDHAAVVQQSTITAAMRCGISLMPRIRQGKCTNGCASPFSPLLLLSLLAFHPKGCSCKALPVGPLVQSKATTAAAPVAAEEAATTKRRRPRLLRQRPRARSRLARASVVDALVVVLRGNCSREREGFDDDAPPSLPSSSAGSGRVSRNAIRTRPNECAGDEGAPTVARP